MDSSHTQADRRREDAVDDLIRRRFAACATLPLFPEPAPSGFFQMPDTGRQLCLLEAAHRRPPTSGRRG